MPVKAKIDLLTPAASWRKLWAYNGANRELTSLDALRPMRVSNLESLNYRTP